MGYIDVLPSLLAAANTPLPSGLDGLNVLPAILGSGSIPERPWFSYLHQNEDAHASVHLGRWKLVAHGDFFSDSPQAPPQLELYDLVSDPTESEDVAARHADQVIDLYLTSTKTHSK